MAAPPSASGSSSQNLEELHELFRRETSANVRTGVLASGLTTYAIGGPLASFVEVDNTNELQKALVFFNSQQIPYRVIGAGSNIVAPDEGMHDWILRLGRGFRTMRSTGGSVFEVGGSMSLMSLCRELSDAGFSGLEFAGGIPASIGGAARMNAGAHGGEISNVLKSVTFIMPDGSETTRLPEELGFSYRHSQFPDGAIVTRVVMSLVESSKEKTALLRNSYLSERKKRQPLTLPSAGSVFKNPSPDKSAGFLIEHAGLKGEMIGGARISPLHANWIVNEAREAKASDVKALVELCQDKVKHQFGIALEPEIIFW